MSQLRLAYSNSKPNSLSATRHLSGLKPRPAKSNPSSGGCSLSPLVKKILLLQERKPRAAALIEKLVDDAIDHLGSGVPMLWFAQLTFIL